MFRAGSRDQVILTRTGLGNRLRCRLRTDGDLQVPLQPLKAQSAAKVANQKLANET
jgi:hypothetical protein